MRAHHIYTAEGERGSGGAGSAICVFPWVMRKRVKSYLCKLPAWMRFIAARDVTKEAR